MADYWFGLWQFYTEAIGIVVEAVLALVVITALLRSVSDWRVRRYYLKQTGVWGRRPGLLMGRREDDRDHA